MRKRVTTGRISARTEYAVPFAPIYYYDTRLRNEFEKYPNLRRLGSRAEILHTLAYQLYYDPDRQMWKPLDSITIATVKSKGHFWKTDPDPLSESGFDYLRIDALRRLITQAQLHAKHGTEWHELLVESDTYKNLRVKLYDRERGITIYTVGKDRTDFLWNGIATVGLLYWSDGNSLYRYDVEPGQHKYEFLSLYDRQFGQNLGFEQDIFDGWSYMYSDKVTYSTLEQRSGTKCLKLLGGPDGTNIAYSKTYYPVRAGDIIEFSIWAKCGVAGSTIRLSIEERDDKLNLLRVIHSDAMNLESNYKQFTLTHRVSENASYVRVFFKIDVLAEDNFAYIDDANVNISKAIADQLNYIGGQKQSAIDLKDEFNKLQKRYFYTVSFEIERTINANSNYALMNINDARVKLKEFTFALDTATDVVLEIFSYALNQNLQSKIRLFSKDSMDFVDVTPFNINTHGGQGLFENVIYNTTDNVYVVRLLKELEFHSGCLVRFINKSTTSNHECNIRLVYEVGYYAEP